MKLKLLILSGCLVLAVGCTSEETSSIPIPEEYFSADSFDEEDTDNDAIEIDDEVPTTSSSVTSSPYYTVSGEDNPSIPIEPTESDDKDNEIDKIKESREPKESENPRGDKPRENDDKDNTDNDEDIEIITLPEESEETDTEAPIIEPSEEVTETLEPTEETESNDIVADEPSISISSYGYPMSSFGSAYNGDMLSTDKLAWYFNRRTDHTPPTAQSTFDIREFDAHYLGDTSSPNIYLTFDEGYENGYTPMILDTLKEKGVTATFFCTEPFIESEPDLVLRMVKEGHTVANHSSTHPSFAGLTATEIADELSSTEEAFYNLTGQNMPKYFRPPMGEYSAQTLQTIKDNGYKTIFWSFAYADWDVNNQPGKQGAYDTYMKDLHNGQITLLHAVSQSNAEALGDMIDSTRAEGFEFKSLDSYFN